MTGKRIATLAGLLALAHLAVAGSGHKVGDRVEAYEYGWSAATLVDIGSGSYAGYYKVRQDKYPKTPVWIKADNIRPISEQAEKQAAREAAERNRVFRNGERVMGYNYGWSAGTVQQAGTGSQAGYFLVKRDDAKTPQWFSASNLKPMAEADAEKDAEAANLARGPRPGKYGIWSYGAPNSVPLYFGELEILGSGQYRTSGFGKQAAGNGAYRYDAATRTVSWLSGPYRDVWEGRFDVRGGGKVHSIYLKRNTVASNGS